jgi:polyisoprenoid-binding protein YceI
VDLAGPTNLDAIDAIPPVKRTAEPPASRQHEPAHPRRLQSGAVSFLEDHLGGGVWRADPPFSSVTFKVRHLGARDYRAGFREIDATLDVVAGTLVASVPVGSLDLNNPVIRERMLSPEFLDAAQFPDVRWTVSDIEGDESRAVTASGELSIHGHTQTVAATGRIGLPGAGLLSPENRVGLELSATVDRRDFGLDWQEELPGGGDTLGWDVTLEALLEFVEQT